MITSKYKVVYFLGLIFLTGFIHSQNLIPNAGFEYYCSCPQSPNLEKQIHKAIGWNAANRATPDFFHTCNGNIPQNYMGFQKPYDGKGYAGILVDGIWKEYLVVMLKEALVKDEEYKITMYVSLSKQSEYAISELGFCFTAEPKYYENEKTITDIIPQVVNDSSNFLDKTDWTLVEGKYKAKGGERFITIGNFQTPAKTKRVPVKPKMNGNTPTPYYYIDNVNTEPIIIKPQNNNELIKLENVYFDYDKSALRDTSYYDLDVLVKRLKKNPDTSIEIMGHTDNAGSKEYNMRLSEKRAKMVADYIIKAGIERTKVSYKGYGNTKPLAENNSEKGKQLNRRVEVRLIKGRG